MIGNPTPIRIPLVMQRLLPTSDAPYPALPQEWHFRQSIDYSITNNLAILDFASRNRETILFNIYRMGKNSIERGSRDEWTPAPHRYAAVAQKMGVPAGGGGRSAAPNAERDMAVLAELRKPELRDPRGYIIPSSQADFPTAVKFVNALRETGIVVQRATREFDVQGRKYPAGSLIVKTDQAFRPHVIDMFEPQDQLPIEDHLAENGQPLPQSKFYTPGSILAAKVDVARPLAHGLKERTDFYFDNNPVFKPGTGAAAQGVTPLAWFDSPTPLRSGWAWGQQYLVNSVAAVEATVGKGRVVLFGPEILKRAQPHATFKLLFNALYLSAATP
jgi:hypothetical protein